MDLRYMYATKNENYKTLVPLAPIGIMLHSTGADNPNLKRYVQPDDGKLGLNVNANSFNQFRPDNQQKCCHAFIGQDKNGNIATYNIFPWGKKTWHCGGKANNTHIGIEICELYNDKNYLTECLLEFSAVAVHLMSIFPTIKIDNIISHHEGSSKGIASAHADIDHWLVRHDMSMETVRHYVKTYSPLPYRVRKTSGIASTQIGAFNDLDNAIKCANLASEYNVFDANGKRVYPT